VTIFPRPFKTPPRPPFALAASFLTATLMLLIAAAGAHGEALDSVTAPANAAPVAEAPLPSEGVQAGEAGETEEVETRVAPVPSAPVAEEPSETQEPASSVTESIDAAVESSPAQHVSKLVENVSRPSVARVAAAADGLAGAQTEPVRNLADDVAQRARHPVVSLPHDLTNSPLPDLTDSLLLHSLPLPSRLLPEAAPRSDAVRIPSPPLRPRSSSPRRVVWSPPPQLMAAPGGAEASGAAERADHGWVAPPSPPRPGFPFSHAGGDRGGSPTPPEIPLPAPGAPGVVASGSGGSIFVPLAALLALLALVAPAVLRRLEEAPEFRPPTPFACALERPG
jgi:hypothetical protein